MLRLPSDFFQTMHFPLFELKYIQLEPKFIFKLTQPGHGILTKGQIKAGLTPRNGCLSQIPSFH